MDWIKVRCNHCGLRRETILFVTPGNPRAPLKCPRCESEDVTELRPGVPDDTAKCPDTKPDDIVVKLVSEDGDAREVRIPPYKPFPQAIVYLDHFVYVRTPEGEYRDVHEVVKVGIDAVVDKTIGPYKQQDAWWDLKDRLGEAGARKELARQLRQAADQVERGGYPDVFGCNLFDGDKLCSKTFIDGVGVTLSYPWPG